MKHLLLTISICLASLCNATDLKVGSFNILGTYPAEHEFSADRAKLAAALVDYRDFDVLGLQEARTWQVDAMKKSGTYEVIGVNVEGQEPTLKNAWTNAILYKKSRLEVLESGHFWLSDTPDTYSKGWAEKQYRNCNWVKFKDKKSGKEFFFFNTHFGLTPDVRKNSAKIFVSKIVEISKGKPFFCTGDYNTEKTEKDTLNELLKDNILNDSWKISKMKPYGPEGTFVCMLYNKRIRGSAEVEDPWRKIDYIFVSKGVKVNKCAVIGDNLCGAYPSDHLPIEAYLDF